MSEYLSLKDFSINFTLLLLPIEKSILNFFSKCLETPDLVGSKIASPLSTIKIFKIKIVHYQMC